MLIATGAVAVFGAPDSFRLLGQGVINSVPIPVLLIAVVAVLGHLVLTRTRLGRYAYVMGSNMEAARLSGVPVKRYTTLVYVLSGALAGLGGMIAASRINSGQPNFGEGLELDVIAAVVIGGASLFGGRGTVLGSLIGAFLVAVHPQRRGPAQHRHLLPERADRRDHLAGGLVGPLPAAQARRRRRVSDDLAARGKPVTSKGARG